MSQCTPIGKEIPRISTAASNTSKCVPIERASGRVSYTNRCILEHKIFMKFGNSLHYSIRWKNYRLWSTQVDQCAIDRVSAAKQRTTRVTILDWVQNAQLLFHAVNSIRNAMHPNISILMQRRPQEQCADVIFNWVNCECEFILCNLHRDWMPEILVQLDPKWRRRIVANSDYDLAQFIVLF